MNTLFVTIREKFPFLTHVKYLENDYLGIVQNCDNQFFSIYIYNQIHYETLRKKFLEFGDEWWWESNRQLPINMYIKGNQFKVFKQYLKTFVRKDVEIVEGPIVSLENIMQKRIKRRQVRLDYKQPDREIRLVSKPLMKA